MKVEEGNLYSDYMKTEDLQILRKEFLLLKKTLFVPRLRVNFLSDRKIYTP